MSLVQSLGGKVLRPSVQNPKFVNLFKSPKRISDFGTLELNGPSGA